MNPVLEKIQKTGIIPVVVINDVKDAEPLAKALIEGGLHVQKLHSVQMQLKNQSAL